MQEYEYINDLRIAVNNSGSLSTVPDNKIGDLADMEIKGKNGELILLEVKNAGTYGELPLSTAIRLKKTKEKFPQARILLVSLSKIPSILAETLNSIDVQYLVEPSVEDTTKKLLEIAG